MISSLAQLSSAQLRCAGCVGRYISHLHLFPPHSLPTRHSIHPLIYKSVNAETSNRAALSDDDFKSRIVIIWKRRVSGTHGWMDGWMDGWDSRQAEQNNTIQYTTGGGIYLYIFRLWKSSESQNSSWRGLGDVVC